MKYWQFVCFFILLFFVNSSQAQVSNRKPFVFLPNQIYLKNGCCFVLNDTIINKRKLGTYLQDNPLIFSQYNNGIKDKNTSQLLGWIALVSLVTSRFTLDNNLPLSGGLAIISLGSIISGKIFQKKSNKKIARAICAYNAIH